MATYWLSTSGTDTASGTNAGVAMKTLSALKASLGQGDIVNVINDGDHPAYATDVWFNLTYAGTNFDSDPGIVIRGTDVSGNKAIATVAFTAGAKQWVGFDDLADYWWVEGIRFDYSALRGVVASGMNPIEITGQPFNCRINDCEIYLTTTTGSSVSLSTNTQVPRFPYYSGASVAHSGTQEIYNNVFLNAQLYLANPTDGVQDIHNNVLICDGADFPSSYNPANSASGNADELRKFYNNTVFFRQYDTSRLDQGAIIQGMNNTTNLVFHSNLFYVETGSNAATNMSNYLIDGVGTAAQTTAVVTCSNNHIVLGPYLAAEASGANDWDTSTATGVYGNQFNSAWRAGGSENGTALNTDDVLTRDASVIDVFFAPASNYTWTPGDYDHDLPYDLRPIIGRTGALGGGVVGAIDDAVNETPVVIAHTYTATSGVLKSVNATSGVLAGSSDADGDTLTATVVDDVSHGVLVLNTTDGSFDYTPNITYVGTDTFTYKAWDGTTFSNVSTATLNVNNQTPSGTPRSYTTPENVALVVSATDGMLAGATDPDPGQTLSITAVGTPSNGTLTSYNTTTGSFVYTPDSFFAGMDYFTFKVTDGGLLSAATTAVIYVTEIAAPVPSDIVDTAPFFRPTLKVETQFRAKWIKNRKKALDLSNYTDDRDWNESTSRTIMLTAAGTKTVTLGGVASAQYLIVETDYPIEVSIDGTDKYWPVSKSLAVALTEYSSIALKSVSTTNAQVILTVVD